MSAIIIIMNIIIISTIIIIIMNIIIIFTIIIIIIINIIIISTIIIIILNIIIISTIIIIIINIIIIDVIIFMILFRRFKLQSDYFEISLRRSCDRQSDTRCDFQVCDFLQLYKQRILFLF